MKTKSKKTKFKTGDIVFPIKEGKEWQRHSIIGIWGDIYLTIFLPNMQQEYIFISCEEDYIKE